MLKHLLKISLFIVCCLESLPINAQVVINEFSPSNISTISNGNIGFDDWIEIYNKGASAVNLQGYGLSDDSLNKFAFTFPSLNLNAGGYALVFASDKNEIAPVDHWETAIKASDTWHYWGRDIAPDTNWRNLSFNPSSWPQGQGGFGFGDGDDLTQTTGKISVMVRRTFTISDTSQLLKAILHMDYDDGFVAYLNGVEIARANMGVAGIRPAFNATATSSSEAVMYQGLNPDSFYINQSLFKSIIRPGSNVLAVEVHNSSATSSDLSCIPFLSFGIRGTALIYQTPPSWFGTPAKEYLSANFKLTRTGETIYLTNPSGTVIDRQTYTSISSDNSLGRKPDGTPSWCLFNTPTPGSSNNSSTCFLGYASSPGFSLSPGFYPSAQTLTLFTTQPGGQIRYTINGDDPTISSTLYTAPISISSTVTIRAKVFASSLLPSESIANTYFIGVNSRLPIFTITTDSLNLWDYNTGIYVMGPNAGTNSPYFGANFWQDWDKPASVEYYDKNRNRITTFGADIAIYGNYSRAKPQKSFEIKLKDRYGLSSINYNFQPDKPYIDNIDNIVLRNSGTDWNVAHFRDAFMERMMKPTNCGYIAAEPAILYLNGQYWGVYTIHENHDEHFVEYNYGYKKNEIDFLKEDGSTITVKSGTDAQWWSIYNYATTTNTSTSQFYSYIDSVIDLKNYMDYFIAETYYDNGDWIGDWTNNIKMWRPLKGDKKFRYLLYDTDFGFGLKGSYTRNTLSKAITPASTCHSSNLFNALLGNPTFKRDFINRYADLINTIYLPTEVRNVMNQFKDSMSFDMPEHFAKWGSTMSNWQSNLNVMTTFSNQRPSYARNFIQSQFGLTSQVDITLKVQPAGAGRVQISTVAPNSYPWTGVYFNGNPVTITAIPNPGYTFDHFDAQRIFNGNNINQSITYNFTNNDVITAVFSGSAESPKLTISEFNYNSSSTNDAGDWIELYNYGSVALDITGWKLKDDNDYRRYQFPLGTVIQPGGYLVVAENLIKFKSIYPDVNNVIGELDFSLNNAGEQIRLLNYNDVAIVSFYFQDFAPWPVEADGQGYTCELLNISGDLSDGTNWSKGCLGGSPGRALNGSLTTNTTVSGNTAFCTGSSVTLAVPFSTGYSYQWRRNGIDIAGATDTALTATIGGSYNVIISNSGCNATTTPILVTVVNQAADPIVTDASRCGAGTVTLQANATDSVFWYSAPDGQLLGTGSSFTTPFISNTTTFYAQVSRVCPSNAVPVNAQITPFAAEPILTNVNRCGPGSVTLIAQDTAETRWYSALNAGALVLTGDTLTLSLVERDTTFYVESGSVCPSGREPIQVTITSASEPVTTSASRCGNGTVVLTATANDNIFWYTAQTGGTLVGSGSSFQTPPLSVTTNYFAEANNGCASARILATAIINNVPNAPVATNGSGCGTGSVTLNATADVQVFWYDAPSGGNQLASGSVFNTPIISTTTTFYAGATDICSSSRVPVVATVNTRPAAPTATSASRCGPGSVTLGASGNQLRWFADTTSTQVGTGTSYSTPSISSTRTYYVASYNNVCYSNYIPVVATINDIPNAPTTTGGNRCGSGSVALTASGASQLVWFAAPSGGTQINTGTAYNTPTLTSTTSYYVSSFNGSCYSSRTAVTATINTFPSAPTVTSASRCGAGSVTLSASSSLTLTWYANVSSGSSLAVGSTYNTPSISATTTYYVSASNGSCESVRVPVIATINAAPADPIITDGNSCGSGSVVLNAASSANVDWFADSTGVTSLASGNTFSTPVLSATTIYYAAAFNGVCFSARVPVTAYINSTPPDPTVFNGDRCGEGSVQLIANSSSTLNWFTAASGGSSIASGSTFNSPVINTTTTYYVEANNDSCSSNRIPVVAVVNNAPYVELGNDTSILQGDSIILDAGPGMNSYLWSNGDTTQIITVSTAGEYSVSVSNGICQSSDQIQISVITNVDPLNNLTYSIFPNPATEFIVATFSGINAAEMRIELIDMTGKVIMKNNHKMTDGENQMVINLPKVSSGVYILHITNDSFTQIERLVIQ